MNFDLPAKNGSFPRPPPHKRRSLPPGITVRYTPGNHAVHMQWAMTSAARSASDSTNSGCDGEE